ncbi:hypothetical protein GCM10018772_20260 [Streptomyces fumanus]|uniref:Uncharacterized protein n=1 Tax=Streptomyces fumanus TaxID=67302 RepID=A0A919AC07_9ACTN|nr:hypothetical protein GCM10018772_20260 [Streptomyces fumanus]
MELNSGAWCSRWYATNRSNDIPSTRLIRNTNLITGFGSPSRDGGAGDRMRGAPGRVAGVNLNPHIDVRGKPL